MARDNNRPQRRAEENDGLVKKTISINRVTKVVKGGKNMRFAAFVVVGDGAGKIGCALGKSTEVPEAIDKATARAKKNMKPVSLLETSIPHEVIGKFGSASVLMKPASEGTGVIAGGPVRAVMEAVGITNIRTKSHGTNNPINVVKAAIAGLNSLRTAEEVAVIRGKSVQEING
ncbi:MAG: 30S ribosomal protein S5 [Clostridia bacterium]|nr:30S ribosomal protein S5 [Clostridia bacterium]